MRRVTPLRLRVEILMSRQGIWLPASVVLVVLAVLVTALISLPAWLDTRDQARRSDITGPRATTDPLGDFRQILGERRHVTRDVSAIFAALTTAGLRVQQATYQYEQSRTGHFDAVRVNVPVTGSFPMVRRGVESVLRNMPSVSVDKIVFARDNAGSRQGEGEIRFSLWLRPEPAAARTMAP